MRKGSIAAGVAAGVFGLALVLGAGEPLAETDKPQVRRHARGRHGLCDASAPCRGTCADWNWKHNHDTGQFYEQLFAADLSKSVKNGGKHPFYADAWLPSDAIRGELAESWEWKENPLRIEIKLRKGIMFPEKPGVMAVARADRRRRRLQLQPARQQPEEDQATYFDHVDKVEATDKHTVVFHVQRTTTPSGTIASAGATTRASMPKEVADAGAANWKNVNGTGPFMLDRLRAGQLQHLRQEPDLLGQGEDQRRRVQAALRRQARLPHHQGRGDLRHRAAHRQARHPRGHSLAERRGAEEERAAAASGRSGSTCRARSWPCASTPSRSTTSACAARSTWPSTRRRSSSAYYNGNAELFAYPHASRLQGLLRAAGGDAGERQGAVRVQSRPRPRSCWPKPATPTASASRCRCARAIPTTWTCCRWSPPTWRRSASRSRSSPWSTRAFLSAMTSRKTNTPGYFMNNGHTNPTTTIRKSFITGQVWNPSQLVTIPPTTRRWTRSIASATRASARPCSRR